MGGNGTRAVPDGQAERPAEPSMNGETLDTGQRKAEFLLASNGSISNNGLAMSSVLKSRSFVHRLESSLISLGMSVFAYLLERMILRSLKKNGAKP